MPDREGEFGYLTTAQWRAFRWAVSYSLAVVPWLYAAGNYSINDPDEARTRSADVQLGMPATMIAAIEIERLSKELGQWANLEDIANDVYGWEIAVLFTREVQTAAARWPIEEKPHKVEHIRCQKCGYLALEYTPPEEGGADSSVTCGECHAVTSGEEFALLAALFAREYAEVKRAG